MTTAVEKFRQQRQAMQRIITKTMKGEDMATVTEEVLRVVEENKLFERDVITGRIRSRVLSDAPENILEPAQAQNLFRTFFSDKMYFIKKSESGQSFRPLKREQQDTIYSQILEMCVYNSRAELYKAIPEWDGVARIETFLRDYFRCDANWHFFLLFLTYIVGVLDNPEKTIIEHWFDFVGDARGTGKTTFFKHLLAGIGCSANAFECSADKRSMDDFWAELYTKNTIIAIDDECHLLEKMSYDTWKSVVTLRYDTFSRKFQQPETHARPFVFVRTSNHPKTVYSLNERRQIIFNVGLRESECLHWQLDNNYMAQLLAEAKYYYENNGGIYQLTPEEKDEILKQNLDNTSTETPEYYLIDKFITYLLENEGKYTESLVSVPDENCDWISWNTFADWTKDEHHNIGNLKYGPVFWKNFEVYSRKNPDLFWEHGKDTSRKRKTTRSTVKVFGLKRRTSATSTDLLDTPDIPF